jgi:hypothetical protein
LSSRHAAGGFPFAFAVAKWPRSRATAKTNQHGANSSAEKSFSPSSTRLFTKLRYCSESEQQATCGNWNGVALTSTYATINTDAIRTNAKAYATTHPTDFTASFS